HEKTGNPDTRAGVPDLDRQLPLILIAEDNKELAGFIYGELSDTYNIILAGNGREAWKMIADYEVQLVISDVMMPISDGVELCRLIKENTETSHIPVILLTAKSAM